MPRSQEQAKSRRTLSAPARYAPARFALYAMAAYFAACLPLLALRHFDPSVFVIAGTRYVTVADTHPRLYAKPNSNGYDGQFYYRLARSPFSTAPRVDGIAFDHPAKRTQRILYPLLVWLASAGQPALTAWAMLAVNLAGLGAIAWLAASLATRLNLPAAVPLAIVAWPGLVVTLLHDTTEIVSTALLLAALSAWFARRPALFAALACCAVLTRETTLAAWLGLLAVTAVTAARTRGERPALPWLLACAAPILVFVAWRQTLVLALHEAPQAQAVAHDLGWPFAGALTMLHDCLTGARKWANTPFKDGVERGYILISALPLLAFCVLAAAALRPAWRKAGAAMPLAAAWCVTAALMSLLSATGPWVDPAAYLRAFTECFVLGCLLLGAAGRPGQSRLVAGVSLAQAGLAWMFCLVQAR